MSKPIEALAERRFKITGRVHKIEPVQVVPNKGYVQKFIIHIPGVKDEVTGRMIRREQFFRVEIFSNKQADSRFLQSTDLQQAKCCSCYLNSYHWTDKDGLQTVPRLSFIEWLTIS